MFMVILSAYMFVLNLRSGWGPVIDLLIGASIGALFFALASGAVALVLAVAGHVPRLFAGALIGAFLAVTLFMGGPRPASLLLSAALVLAAALLGGSIAVATAYDFKIARTLKRVLVSLALLIAVGAYAMFFVWMGSAGTEEGLVKVEEPTHAPVPQLIAEDPSLPGPFKVNRLTYGSGEDRREEFGAQAQLKTRCVDGKPFLTKLDGWFAPLRKNFWGFDWRKLPLNGRVWYPDADGKFPLVLIVHGNHFMREYSDPGYAYLGELLASRGYIFVSVDENFLNGDWTDNYNRENDARGWVMLEHLKVWREWNEQRENPFFHKVDLDRISLIGHSRGGEAVAVAAAFNRLPYYPDDARVKFDYKFNIRSIIEIAPIDGQYKPSGRSTPLENIDYLVLQGAHDADVSFFSGDRQYKRLKFTDGQYHFKTSIYIYRANHGQFNTVWANRDFGVHFGYFLNIKPLLDGEDQRKIAKVYMSAFLETTLRGGTAYLPLFKDYRVASAWLPATYYVNRFEDSRTRIVSDYDEDIDVTTTTVSGGSQQAENLATWKEKDIGYRAESVERQNQAVYVGWKYGENDSSAVQRGSLNAPSRSPARRELIRPASYSITLPEDLGRSWKLEPSTVLLFSLAQPDEKPAEPDSLDKSDEGMEENADSSKAVREKEEQKKESEEKAEDETKPKKPIDFTLEVEDGRGQKATLPLSSVVRLLPPLKSQFTKYSLLEENYKAASEPILQTVEVPLKRFIDQERRFNPATIRSIRFRFDRSPSGVIILDEVGFRLER
jgi:dienelactone hydrolase